MTFTAPCTVHPEPFEVCALCPVLSCSVDRVCYLKACGGDRSKNFEDLKYENYVARSL